MVDPLVTQTELETLLGKPLDDAVAALLLATASGVVRGAVGLTLSAVAGDEHIMMGRPGLWLDLPERPVTEVGAVLIDGVAVTDYKRFGARLWRRGGWATCPWEPSTLEITYSHGWATGDWHLEPARSMVMTLAANKIENALGAVSESIDDYRVRYAVTAEDLPEHAADALRATYIGEAGYV